MRNPRSQNRTGWIALALLLAIASTAAVVSAQEAGVDQLVEKGRVSYLAHCASCHGREGQGLKALYPALTDSAYLGDRIGELPCLISSGVRGKIVTGKRTKNIRMPAFADLSIEQMNSLISYLQLNWGKGGETVSEQKINQWLRSCP